jgi:hypothetical protein
VAPRPAGLLPRRRGDVLRHDAQRGAQRTAQRPGVARSLLTLPTDYGLLACLFLLFGTPALFVPAYTLLFAAAAGFLALASVKWFTEMEGLPR